jgi:multicomponent Na+:H+ antiporter subunit E
MEEKKNKIQVFRNFVSLFLVLLITWMALTRSLDIDELILGVLVSLLLSFFSYRSFHIIGFPRITFKRILYSFLFLLVLFKEIVVANVDVAYRVLHPKMPIKPGIVIIKTELKQDLAKLILANSITLTPGTFTLDIADDELLIHWINVKTDRTEEATTIIGERFEKYLKVIFQS